jgi:hypothetical protein
VLLPNTLDPVTNVVGTLAMVRSALYGDRHVQEVKHHLLAPRIGLAYRVTNNTVIRAGYGLNHIPPDMMSIYSSSALINRATTSFDNTQLGVANYRYLNNPFPSPIVQSTGRSNTNFMTNYVNKNQNINGVYPYQPYPYMQQWNLSLGHQFAGDVMVDLGYGGSRGTHLPMAGNINFNELSSKYWNATDAKAANRRYPYYNNVNMINYYGGNSFYHSMQAKVEKRFKSGGVLLGSYTWAKLIANTDSTFGYLEAKSAAGGPNTGTTGGYQDYNNLASERSLSSFDAPHRLMVSYVVELPFGNGKKFAKYGGVAGALVSGWGLNGIATFQTGFPLAFYSSTNSLSSFGIGTIRPNVVSGCDAAISGSAQSRLNKWFNTACYTAPSNYTLGNASRTDPKLRAPGINNWDLSLLKTSKIKERVNLQFRVEFFNLFNRVQFAPPNTTVGSATFGKVVIQLNQPRLIQLNLRLSF